MVLLGQGLLLLLPVPLHGETYRAPPSLLSCEERPRFLVAAAGFTISKAPNAWPIASVVAARQPEPQACGPAARAAIAPIAQAQTFYRVTARVPGDHVT